MIQASPTAPDGLVIHLSKYAPETFQPSDAILCRNSAPLIAFAFALLRHDIGCRVLGREIGASLISLIDKAKSASIVELENKLDAMRARELNKAIQHNNESAIASIEDKYDCLALFVEHADTVEEVKSKINSLFDDSNRGLLTLSTIHKAKGLEWTRVFILDWHLVPSKWAKQPWQTAQERHLQYVAVTRAKLELIFINSGNWEKPKPSPNVEEAENLAEGNPIGESANLFLLGSLPCLYPPASLA